MIKVKTKISGQFKALQQQFAIIRSVNDTATKGRQSVFHAIAGVVNCFVIGYSCKSLKYIYIN